MAGAAVQALLALVVTQSSGFLPYAMATSVFVAVQIFTHTFIFGWLSQHDTSGRAVALTPAMLMSGAAIGPVLGGVLTASFGMASLGAAVLAIDAIAVFAFWRAMSTSQAAPAHPVMPTTRAA